MPRTQGRKVAAFAERFIRQTKGRWAGEPLTLERWQADLLDELYLVDDDGANVYREALIGVARKNGKALGLDTPIPTPGGWAKMGDLRVGDLVFGADGEPTVVVAATQPMFDRPCYRMTFGDGETIVADAEHLWLTDDRARSRRAAGGSGLRTTREIARTLEASSGKRHRVELAGALELPERELPVDPYVLGAWLGDGSSAAGQISNPDPEVWTGVAREHALGPVGSNLLTRTAYGLQTALREAGALGRKHIPPEYLRASRRQRLALLRGLMDTDGTSSARGMCEFDNTNRALVDGVVELVSSLGLKPSVHARRAVLNGVDCGPSWRVQFTAYSDFPVFTVARKLARQKPPPPRRTRSQVRCIVAVEPMESVPVRCIQVSAPDGMFLAGKAMIPTHNSTLAAAIALYGLVAAGEDGPEVYSAAASKDQARVVFDQARSFVEASPLLSDWLRPMRSVITCPANGGVYRVLSSDAPRQHGLNPSVVVIDELHAHRDPELYYALTTGQLARLNPLVVSITTAGFDRESICHQVYEYGREVEKRGLDGMRAARFLFRWWQAAITADLDDEATWRAANPSSWIDLHALRRERQRLPEHVFRRLHLNQWTASEKAWLPPHAWERCQGDATIPDGARVFLGVDLGLKHDSAAVALVHQRADGTWAVRAKVLEPPGDGTTLDIAAVEQLVRDFARRYTVVEAAYDPWRFERSAQQLGDEGIPMVEFPMSNERTAPASAALYEAIVERRIVHDGDRVLSAHVAAGATVDTERGWRLTKRKAKKKVDALMALLIAHRRSVEGAAPRASRVPVFS